MAWNTDLDAYAHYWGSALGKSHDHAKAQMRDIRADVEGTWGKADDPLGAHTPMAQDAILNRLGKLAAGRIDDWESHVDPRLSPGENYSLLLEKGAELPEEEKEEVRRAIAETVDAREQDRAASLLRENVEAIDAGEETQLASDIAAEYGREFVDETLHAARVDAGMIDDETADDSAPVVSANTDEMTDDVETIEAADDETADVDADGYDVADAVADLEETTTEPTDDAAATTADDVETREPTEDRASGTLRGLLRAAYAAVIVPYEQGRQAGRGATHR